MISNPLFAILDIETTGFSPNRGDKIVEIAIITTDFQGKIIDIYETLINPRRDVGPTNIHGITAEMVKKAPFIENVIDDVIYQIQNKTIVGHNISFDLRFVNYEIDNHLSYHIDLKGICTLQLSNQVIPDLPARRLECFCDYFDIQNSSSHTAFGDCRATAELFHIFKSNLLDSYGKDHFIKHFVYPTIIHREIMPKRIEFKRADAIKLKVQENNRLMELINRLPANSSDSINVQQYLNLLDEILMDRIITDAEIRTLREFGQVFNISQKQAIEIHQEYLRKLIRLYLLDGILSLTEINDLVMVCELLCIKNEDLEKFIEYEKSRISDSQIENKISKSSDYVGKTVCFTGQLNSRLGGLLIERSVAQQIAMEHGLIIKSGVSNKLDFLVASDPNSLSGKAQKARELGVKIVAEPVFWSMIGLKVE